MLIHDIEVNVLNDVTVEPTNLKIIEFEEDYGSEIAGVNYTINGYNRTLVDILLDIKYDIDEKLKGTRAIAEMKPGTALSSETLYIDEDVYDVEKLSVAENAAIVVTEELIEDAKNSVREYLYVLRLLDLMINGAEITDKSIAVEG